MGERVFRFRLEIFHPVDGERLRHGHVIAAVACHLRRADAVIDRVLYAVAVQIQMAFRADGDIQLIVV